MNLVAHSHYKRIADYRDLTPQQEWELLEKGLNRVTDTCIPEDEAFRKIQKHIEKLWKDANAKGERKFPHEFIYELLLGGVMKNMYEIDPKDSWMIAAAEKNIPIVRGGWEDSTLGNIFASYIIKGEMKPTTMKSGVEYMVWLADWYKNNCSGKGVGFFQIGGGIAGDFPICVVPMMYQDLKMPDIPFWSYFCQISDSTTSYGSYSGAVPNEKITWGKLDITTPKYIVESDATIVAPLIFLMRCTSAAISSRGGPFSGTRSAIRDGFNGCSRFKTIMSPSVHTANSLDVGNSRSISLGSFIDPSVSTLTAFINSPLFHFESKL
jgi:deoxyhypusine synthase